MHRRIFAAVGMAASLVVLAACSQTPAAPAESIAHPAAIEVVQASVSASASSDLPKPFSTGDVRIAVVRQLNTGDVYQNWIDGVQSQADALGITLDIYDADGDNAKQALFLDQAISTKPDGILIGWGFAESLEAGIVKAQEAGIPVATYYVETEPGEGLVTIDQGDNLMMEGILEQLVQDVGDSADVIYVYVAGYQALDLRNVVWEEFLGATPGINVVSTVGVVNSNTAAQVADQTKAALTANPDVRAIVAPYDEFAKGATLAVQELGLEESVKVYGMDISTADIAVMTAPGSPWVVTATTDGSNVGSVSLRVIALKIAGQLDGNHLSVPPLTVTRDELVDNDIKNVEQLADYFPTLLTPGLMVAPWME